MTGLMFFSMGMSSGLLIMVWVLKCMCDPNPQLQVTLERALNILRVLVAEPDGCPMCDSGKLRNPGQEHWDNCGFKAAIDLLSESRQ